MVIGSAPGAPLLLDAWTAAALGSSPAGSAGSSPGSPGSVGSSVSVGSSASGASSGMSSSIGGSRSGAGVSDGACGCSERRTLDLPFFFFFLVVGAAAGVLRKKASQPGNGTSSNSRQLLSSVWRAQEVAVAVVAVDRRARVVDEVHQVLEALRLGEGARAGRCEVLGGGRGFLLSSRRSMRTGSEATSFGPASLGSVAERLSAQGVPARANGAQLLGRLAQVGGDRADVLHEGSALIGEPAKVLHGQRGPRAASRGTSPAAPRGRRRARRSPRRRSAALGGSR